MPEAKTAFSLHVLTPNMPIFLESDVHPLQPSLLFGLRPHKTLDDPMVYVIVNINKWLQKNIYKGDSKWRH